MKWFQLSSTQAWSLVHIAIGLAALGLLTTASGCDELKLKEKAPDIGQEFSVESVQEAIAKALDGVYFSDLKAGDGAFYESNYRIETSAPVLATTLEENVTHRLSCGSSTRLVVQETFTDHTQKPTVPTISSRYIDFPNLAESVATSSVINSLMPNRIPWVASSSVRTLSEDPPRQTLHNLKVSLVSVPAPQANPDCDRYPDCKIDATEIRVDIVTWKDAKTPQVAKILWRVSRQTHALAATLSQCRSQLMELEGRNFYVNQCEVLRDFWFGDASAPDQPGTPELCPK